MEVYNCKCFDEGEEAEIRQRAYQLCSEYLNGAWTCISPHQLVIRKVGGGLSNLLYYCALPSDVRPVGCEPRRALLRLYGSSHDGENVLEAHFSECVVFTMLSEKQSGPRLYGIFPGGRLEQYIPGRPLRVAELQDDEVSRLVAEACAEIHSMSVPLSKEPSYLWTTMLRWIQQIESNMCSAVGSDANSNMVHTLRGIDLRAELSWLRTFCDAVNSPVVFSHNDLNEGNIMLKHSHTEDKSIVLIDFEYCSYNYRAYDLANHFCETIYDYSNETFPFFWIKPENFPSKEKQALFVARYLRKLHKSDSVAAEEIEQVLEEVQRFILASNLYWAIWSMVMASNTSITFDYWGFGRTRLSAYFKHKEQLLNREVAAGGVPQVPLPLALEIELPSSALIHTAS